MLRPGDTESRRSDRDGRTVQATSAAWTYGPAAGTTAARTAAWSDPQARRHDDHPIAEPSGPVRAW